MFLLTNMDKYAILPIALSQTNIQPHASNTTPRRRALCARPGRSVSRVGSTLTVEASSVRCSPREKYTTREQTPCKSRQGVLLQVLAHLSSSFRRQALLAGSSPARLNSGIAALTSAE